MIYPPGCPSIEAYLTMLRSSPETEKLAEALFRGYNREVNRLEGETEAGEVRQWHREAAAAVKAKIRAECTQCDNGVAGMSGGIDYVTREMAIDAGDRSLEGTPIDSREPVECEYCGRPMRTVEPATIAAHDPSGPALEAAEKALEETINVCAAMFVFVAEREIGVEAMTHLAALGVVDGFGVRARSALAAVREARK